MLLKTNLESVIHKLPTCQPDCAPDYIIIGKNNILSSAVDYGINKYSLTKWYIPCKIICCS